MADRAVENPVREDDMEFDIFVKVIWFLLRMLTDDGAKKPKRDIGLGEEAETNDVMI